MEMFQKHVSIMLSSALTALDDLSIFEQNDHHLTAQVAE
jgi:hypothetical protein